MSAVQNAFRLSGPESPVLFDPLPERRRTCAPRSRLRESGVRENLPAAPSQDPILLPCLFGGRPVGDPADSDMRPMWCRFPAEA